MNLINWYYVKSKKIYRKILKICDKKFAKLFHKRLNNTDFSIICNNCWGGYVYRKYDLPYLSPLIGCYIFPSDYIKLCRNLRHYMESPLKFIGCYESKHRDVLIEKKQQNVPIGTLDDIEVIFLHYENEYEAKKKWERRAKRINYNNLIFKFSVMNDCLLEDLKQFDELKYQKKICFVPPEMRNVIRCAVPFGSAVGKPQIDDDTSEYGRYINLTKLINSDVVIGKTFTK